MNKEITYYINYRAYTINVDEDMEKQLTKYLDLNKDNNTKDLLAAYIRVTQEYLNFKKDVENISDKLARF